MMRVLALLLILLSAPAANEGDAALLRRLTQSLLDAVAPGDRGVWEPLLHSDYIHLDENGVLRTRAELLEELRPLPSGLVGRIEIDRFEVRFHGDTAVTAYELQEYLTYHGQELRSRFRSSDTWRKQAGAWQLVSTHTAAVLKDPPAIVLPPHALCEYEGRYRLTPAIAATIRVAGQRLLVEREGRDPVHYEAELRDLFFVRGQPRSRRVFRRGADGRIVGFADRREGEDILWDRIEPVRSDACR